MNLVLFIQNLQMRERKVIIFKYWGRGRKIVHQALEYIRAKVQDLDVLLTQLGSWARH